SIVFLATPLAANHVISLRGAYVASAGKHYVENLYRWCGSSAAAQASPWDAFADIETNLGAMTIGFRLIMIAKVFDVGTGLYSAGLRAEDTII
ncbi:hypothetical protein LCGC14_2346370, partial [marine sediment metagenome]